MWLKCFLLSIFLLSTKLLLTRAAYSCDPAACVAPKCFCASTNPPGNIPIDQVPQFVVLTFDDAIQDASMKVVKSLIDGKRNPNGCPITTTYFAQILYTDFGMVTDWSAAEHEIADHTMTHPNLPGEDEIVGNIKAFNAYSGIARSKIAGFRAPYLNYTVEMLQTLAKLGFTYDSSITASQSDTYWPYTLDFGVANECWRNAICDAGVKLPGFFEFPMYNLIADDGREFSMDPMLGADPDVVEKMLVKNFDRHFQNGKAPFGIYLHPAQLTITQPTGAPPATQIAHYNSFLQYAMSKPNVYVVTYSQVIAWIKNPVPASKLNEHPAFKCTVPKLGTEICNGLDDNGNGNIDEGLKQQCNLPTTSFSTCYNCPTDVPSPSNPIPNGADQKRFQVSDTCDMLYWDPIAGKCLCQDTSCAFTDLSIGNRTGGANGGSNGSSSSNGSSGNSTDAGSNPQSSDAWKVGGGSRVTTAIMGAVVTLISKTLFIV